MSRSRNLDRMTRYQSFESGFLQRRVERTQRSLSSGGNVEGCCIRGRVVAALRSAHHVLIRRNLRSGATPESVGQRRRSRPDGRRDIYRGHGFVATAQKFPPFSTTRALVKPAATSLSINPSLFCPEY